MARPKKARVEGADAVAPVAASPKPRGELAVLVADFRARFPEEWEALRLCPLQHGLEAMCDKLKG